jgi:hypothetical protein
MQDSLVSLSEKLGKWAGTLDSTSRAMLVDLLAKAGADVYGADRAANATTPAGGSVDSSALSTLETDDFKHALAGVFAAERSPRDL